jgi:hypothetical protein
MTAGYKLVGDNNPGIIRALGGIYENTHFTADMCVGAKLKIFRFAQNDVA